MKVLAGKATKKQLLEAIFEQSKKHFKRMERIMTDIVAVVEQLKVEVDAAVGRLQTKIDNLTQANAALQAALTAAQVDDADAAAALAASNQAVAEMQEEITALQNVGVDVIPPAPPVEPEAPVEPGPVEEQPRTPQI